VGRSGVELIDFSGLCRCVDRSLLSTRDPPAVPGATPSFGSLAAKFPLDLCPCRQQHAVSPVKLGDALFAFPIKLLQLFMKLVFVPNELRHQLLTGT
jgi:hypothetical protein